MDSNAYYIRRQRWFISLKEEFRKLESEIELQQFQNIVRKNRDSNDAKKNQNAKTSLTVSGTAILNNECHKISQRMW